MRKIQARKKRKVVLFLDAQRYDEQSLQFQHGVALLLGKGYLTGLWNFNWLRRRGVPCAQCVDHASVLLAQRPLEAGECVIHLVLSVHANPGNKVEPALAVDALSPLGESQLEVVALFAADALLQSREVETLLLGARFISPVWISGRKHAYDEGQVLTWLWVVLDYTCLQQITVAFFVSVLAVESVPLVWQFSPRCFSVWDELKLHDVWELGKRGVELLKDEVSAVRTVGLVEDLYGNLWIVLACLNTQQSDDTDEDHG